MSTLCQPCRSISSFPTGILARIRIVVSGFALLALILASSVREARADIYIWAEEAGGSTTFRYEGSFDHTGLTYLGTGGPYPMGSFTVGPPQFRTVSNFQIYPSGTPGPTAESLRMPGGLKFPQFGSSPRYLEEINQSTVTYGPGTTIFGWYDDQVYAPGG